MDTDALIQDLTLHAKPVRPLAPPEIRALGWLVLAMVIAVAIMAIHGIDGDELRLALSDPRMVGEMLATGVTAVSAVVVAFQSTVPGASQRWYGVPFAGLAAWVLLTSSGCAADYARLGPAAFGLRLDTACFAPGAAIGAVLTVLVILMLKRGAPLVPRLTLVFAGIAVAATTNLALLVLHEGDVSIMLLVWHTGYVATIAAIGALVARGVLGWPSRRKSRG